MKQEGILIYDERTDRIDIRFGLEDYYGGLHCGTALEVYIDEEWIPSRIEMGDDWYLTEIKTDRLPGLTVRI